MENNTITQVETKESMAFFNANGLITINVSQLENPNIENYCELFLQTDLIKAIQLRNQLDIAINDYLSTIKELYENN